MFHKHPKSIVYIILLLLTLLLRFPYFFHSVIDWDESTYIIMGQDILDGYLPYTHYWDIKPPLAFFHYALCILLFGKSVVAVRLGGVFCIFLAGCIVYAVGKRVSGPKAGFWSAIFLILFSSSFDSWQAVMTEHFTLVPASLFLYLLLTKPYTKKVFFLLGLLLGVMTLTRTNLILLGVVSFVVLLIDRKGTPFQARSFFRKLFTYVLGFFLLPVTMSTVYWLSGNGALLVKSAIVAPLRYCDYSQGFARLAALMSSLGAQIISRNFLLWFLCIVGAVVGFVSVSFRAYRKAWRLLIGSFLVCVVSMVGMGRVYSHYFIQLIPFMALVAGIFLAQVCSLKERGYTISFLVLVGVYLVFPLQVIGRQYFYLGSKVREGKPIWQGYEVVEYLREHNVDGQYIYLCEYHIGYFLTGAKSPTKYVHPSNVSKEFILQSIDGPDASAEKELAAILRKEPLFIVKPEKVWYFDFHAPRLTSMLIEEIARKYTLDKQIGGLLIYKRNSH